MAGKRAKPGKRWFLFGKLRALHPETDKSVAKQWPTTRRWSVRTLPANTVPTQKLPPQKLPSRKAPAQKVTTQKVPVKFVTRLKRRVYPGLRRLRSLQVGLWALLLATAIGVGGLAVLGVQLIVDPQAVAWLNRIVPNWVPLPVTGLKSPQTLLAIQAEVKKAGRNPGAPLWLSATGQLTESRASQADFLLPLLEQRPNCSEACEQIVELRLYQSVPNRGQGKSTAQQFQLMDQVGVVGPSETVVTAPLVEDKAAKPGTVRSLPFKALTRLDMPKSLSGVWLNLEGWLVRGDRTLTYGHMLYLNPQRMRLGFLLEWHTTGTEPQWQEVTAGGHPEWVVDQTLGLEPKFRVYQVRSSNNQLIPVKLEPISLGTSAIQKTGYTQALALARTGLWSPAVALLDRFRQDQPKVWTPAAQAQRDLIQLHARVTQNQATRTWPSPGQQALVNLLDGRWEEGLQIFQAKPDNRPEIVEWLQTDRGQIQSRVAATLKVFPAHLAAKTWGALLAAVQKGGKAGAILWLRQQPQTSLADRKTIMGVVSRLSPTSSEAVTMLPATYGQLLGTAQIAPQIVPQDWFKPDQESPLTLGVGQAWYRVSVSRVFDGNRWRSPQDLNLDTIPKKLWNRLRLSIDPRLQVVSWSDDGQPQTLSVTIRALRWSGQRLEILAMGEPFSALGLGKGPDPLAFSDYAVQWFSPGTAILADLVQQQPAWAKRAIPVLASELNTARALPPDTSLDWAGLEAVGLGTWSVELAPITHPTKPDVVLTLMPPTESEGKATGRPRSLIFSATGQLLYSEFSMDAGQTYVAIATLGTSSTPTLVVEDSGQYNLLRWSPKEQRFRF